MGRGRFLVAFDERISNMKHEVDVLLTKKVEVWVIKVCNSKSLFRQSVLSRLHKKRELALALGHHHVECNVAYLCCYRVCCQ